MNDQFEQSLSDIPVSPRQIALGIVIALAVYPGYGSFYTVSGESAETGKGVF